MAGLGSGAGDRTGGVEWEGGVEWDEGEDGMRGRGDCQRDCGEKGRLDSPEFDLDLDGPLVEIVFVFVDANDAGAVDLLHVVGE